MPRNAAARLLYAASESDADILYPTRFFAPDPFLFVQVQRHGSKQVRRKRYLVMSDLEMDRARAQSSVDRVLSWSKAAREVEFVRQQAPQRVQEDEAQLHPAAARPAKKSPWD